MACRRAALDRFVCRAGENIVGFSVGRSGTRGSFQLRLAGWSGAMRTIQAAGELHPEVVRGGLTNTGLPAHDRIPASPTAFRDPAATGCYIITAAGPTLESWLRCESCSRTRRAMMPVSISGGSPPSTTQ